MIRLIDDRGRHTDEGSVLAIHAENLITKELVQPHYDKYPRAELELILLNAAQMAVMGEYIIRNGPPQPPGGGNPTAPTSTV